MEAVRERKTANNNTSCYFISVAGVECQVKIEVKHIWIIIQSYFIVVIPFLHRNNRVVRPMVYIPFIYVYGAPISILKIVVNCISTNAGALLIWWETLNFGFDWIELNWIDTYALKWLTISVASNYDHMEIFRRF